MALRDDEFHIRLSGAERRTLEELAALDGVSLADTVRTLIKRAGRAQGVPSSKQEPVQPR